MVDRSGLQWAYDREGGRESGGGKQAADTCKYRSTDMDQSKWLGGSEEPRHKL